MNKRIYTEQVSKPITKEQNVEKTTSNEEIKPIFNDTIEPIKEEVIVAPITTIKASNKKNKKK